MAFPGKRDKQSESPTCSVGSDEDLKIYCQPCDTDGPRLPPHGYCRDCQEHLCESCFIAHKKHSLSRHHTLLDKNSMPQTITSVPGHQSQPDNLTKPCPKHKKEVLKFYCQNHKVLLCSVCVTLQHTVTSCKVDYIPNISDQIINSKEHQDILKAMDTITTQYQKKLADVKKMTAKSNSFLIDVLANIKKFRDEINQRLDKLERQAEDAATAIQQRNDKNLKTAETTCDHVTKSLKMSSDSIKYLNTSKQADRLFMELKSAEQMITDYEKRIQELSANDIKEFCFKPNKAISTSLENEKSLGTLTEKTADVNPHQGADVNPHQGEICIKTSKDSFKCLISGMTHLTPDILVITDRNNNAIKLVDINTQSLTDCLHLDTWPWDVTSVTSTELAATRDVTSVTSTKLAATLPDKQTIQFISLSSNKLKKNHTLNTQGKCYGISCYHGKLAVSFRDPAKLQILDNDGTILTTVKGENTFSKPLYVTTNTNSIYVSDWGTETVTRLNWKGKVAGSYSGITDRCGITLSDDGTVFVCDVKRNVIEGISGDCSTGKVVQRDIKHPLAVCWCAGTRTLYFSCRTQEDKHDNFLKVFKLSKLGQTS